MSKSANTRRSRAPLTVSSVALVVLAAPLCAVPAFAADEKADMPVSFEISTGIEYDGNVSVEDIDLNTAKEDFAGVLEAEAEFETDLGKDTELKAGYNFSNSVHFDVDGFDIMSHRGSASLEHDFGPLGVGLSGMVAQSSLDGNSFLTLSRISPSASAMFGKQLFVRAAYDYTDKDFDNRTDRDAEAHGGGGMVFWFLDGAKRYVSAGYKFKTEDAFDNAFDYDAHTLRLRFSNDFEMGGREVEFDAGWKYERREYDQIDILIGAAREDDRHRFTTSLEIPFASKFYTKIELGYEDRSSNDPSVTTTRGRAGIKIGARF